MSQGNVRALPEAHWRRVVAMSIAASLLLVSCKRPVSTVREEMEPPPPAGGEFIHARQQTFSQAAIAETAFPDDPNANEDTPEPEPLIDARADNAAVQALNAAFDEAEVQTEAVNLIGLPMEACKGVLKQWAERADDAMVGHACVATFIGTFIATYLGAQKLSRFVRRLPFGTPLNGFLRSTLLDPVTDLAGRTRAFFAGQRLPHLGRNEAVALNEGLKPGYLQASSAVSLRNPQWASKVLHAVAVDPENGIARSLMLEASLQTKSRALQQLIGAGADPDTVRNALVDFRRTQTLFVAQMNVLDQSRELLRGQVVAGTADQPTRELYERLVFNRSHSRAFNEQVRLQRRLASISADATKLQNLRSQAASTPNVAKSIATLEKRMAMQANEAVAIKGKIKSYTANARALKSDVLNPANYDDVLKSVDDLAGAVPDNPAQLLKDAAAHADDLAGGTPKLQSGGVFRDVAQDAAKGGGARFGKALAVGGAAFQVFDTTTRGFRAHELLQEQRPGKAALTLAFAAIPAACAATGAVFSGGLAAPAAFIGCGVAVTALEGAIAGDLDSKWEAKLDRQGALNELALLGECRSENSNSESCRDVIAQAEAITQRAIKKATSGEKPLSKQEVAAIAEGKKSPPPSQVGPKPESFDQARYICAKGSEGGRNFTAGEKVLLRKSDADGKSAAAVKALFVVNPQGPYMVGKSKLCTTPTFAPEVEAKKNNSGSNTLTANKNSLTDAQKARGRCVIKVWEDAGFHTAWNCQAFAADMSTKNGGDYQCQRCAVHCCCKFMLQRVLENQMKLACEHQLGTWTQAK